MPTFEDDDELQLIPMELIGEEQEWDLKEELENMLKNDYLIPQTVYDYETPKKIN